MAGDGGRLGARLHALVADAEELVARHHPTDDGGLRVGALELVDDLRGLVGAGEQEDHLPPRRQRALRLELVAAARVRRFANVDDEALDGGFGEVAEREGELVRGRAAAVRADGVRAEQRARRRVGADDGARVPADQLHRRREGAREPCERAAGREVVLLEHGEGHAERGRRVEVRLEVGEHRGVRAQRARHEGCRAEDLVMEHREELAHLASAALLTAAQRLEGVQQDLRVEVEYVQGLLDRLDRRRKLRGNCRLHQARRPGKSRDYGPMTKNGTDQNLRRETELCPVPRLLWGGGGRGEG